MELAGASDATAVVGSGERSRPAIVTAAMAPTTSSTAAAPPASTHVRRCGGDGRSGRRTGVDCVVA